MIMMLTQYAFRNATASALNQTQDYFGVLEEVSKYNVHLGYFEKLWAVCTALIPFPDIIAYFLAVTSRKTESATLILQKTNWRCRLGTYTCRTTLLRPVS